MPTMGAQTEHGTQPQKVNRETLKTEVKNGLGQRNV